MAHPSLHTMSPEDVAHAMDTVLATGLSAEEARARLRIHGHNKIEKVDTFHIFAVLLRQILSPLTLVLCAAGLATFFVGDTIDSLVIMVALLINIGLGLYQEGKASRIFDTLARALAQETTVLRDGVQIRINTEEVVSGDVVILEMGKSVPADARVVESQNMSVNESTFTGEWLPVKKVALAPSPDIAERVSPTMVWGGTTISDGTGKAIVVATGARTAFAHLAQATQSPRETQTPLLHSVNRMAQLIGVVVLVVLVLTTLAGIMRGEDMAAMLLIAIAVAVSAMPEGLPAAITVTLSVAMERIMRRGGLVKSLLAAETLGSTTVILTDKTGTLTTGDMRVAAIHPAGKTTERMVIMGAVLASDGFMERRADGTDVPRGRPVEQAIVREGAERSLTLDSLAREQHTRTDFLTFSSARRYAGAHIHHPQGDRVYLSGAPEKMLDVATHVEHEGVVIPCTEEERERMRTIQSTSGREGFKCIGISYVPVHAAGIPESVRNGTPEQVVFLGFLALSDTVRPDVREEIARARGAHVRVIMVTGDYPETARSVAFEAGITTVRDAPVLVGTDIESMTDEEVRHRLTTHLICARVLPETKLRLVRVLRAAGEVVAMTGDGVNDAPALVAADIGVALGSGTDTAKAAGDMVLTYNTFSTITVAIEEGRRAVDNLRKSAAYLLSTSVGEVSAVVGAIVCGVPIPLLASQLLWVNIIHEGFMSVPYAFDPADPNTMKRRPRGLHENILTRQYLILLAIISVLGSAMMIAFFMTLFAAGVPIEKIRTLVFGALSLLALSYTFSLKDIRVPLWRVSIFDNTMLLLGMGVSLALLAVTFTVPSLRTLLSLEPLSLFETSLLLFFALSNVAVMEVAKAVTARLAPRSV
jgi:Ca2+-transporting ATPase